MSDQRRRLLVNGVVQGVGFRPFVFNLAMDEQLTGFVTNTSDGVIIEIQGPAASLEQFAGRLRDEAPPLSIIVSVEETALEVDAETGPDFEIRPSQDAPGTTTLIPPDVATCRDCLREIRDPADRRHGYPFTNCTNCGPRWTIIGRIPYDRPYTSMAEFKMCAACRAEYDDPRDRRFHAQPNACPDCGPKVWLEENTTTDALPDDGDENIGQSPLESAARLLAAGRIVAIKGLGGFHLAVRADNQAAVLRLRDRKHREAKPLALMAADLEAVGHHAQTDLEEIRLLTGPQAPIVLLEPTFDPTARPLAAAVAAGHRRIGFMLPYTPLHHLLFDALAPHGIDTLVMTSGNTSDEPICLDNDEALGKVAHIADAWLLHDRGILRRADDSVMQVLDGESMVFRRSRGYAPLPIFLTGDFKITAPVLAVGPELKNTICLLKEDRAFLSPHIGDLENLEAFEFFRETIGTLQDVLECEAEVIAHDLHPAYLSTRWAKEQAARDRILVPVQHHHAHMAAVLAEHGLNGRALGLILDGTGYGTDGTIWGGELLVGDTAEFERLGHLDPVPLPGGDAAVRAPWRTAVSYLRFAFGDTVPPAVWSALPGLAGYPVARVLEILEKRINSPLTSSCGRLFDAVAALTGRWSEAHYEAQAAIELMALTDSTAVAAAELLPEVMECWRLVSDAETLVIPVAPIIRAVVDALDAGASAAEISARFHHTLIVLLTSVVETASRRTGLADVVLAGGVFQNEILLDGLMVSLAGCGLQPWRPVAVPANDGAVALGQAVIARAQRSQA